MGTLWHLLTDFAIILILLVGIRQFRSPGGARLGNLTAAFALSCALAVVLYRNPILDPAIVASALLLGGAVGWGVAIRVSMIQIPPMVAFQHGAGGIAAFLVSFVELTRDPLHLTGIGRLAGILGILIGAATFSGSMVASGKLASVLKQTPTVLPKHDSILFAVLVVAIALGVLAANAAGAIQVYALLAFIFVAVVLGIVFSVRIGGADMPVLISFLNATAGLAAAFCGIVIQNRLLIACGATVAASGSILTHVMCKAMNRNLLKVFVGIQFQHAAGPLHATEGDSAPTPLTTPLEPAASDQSPRRDPFPRAIEAARNAQTVVIIPGYGMALAHAQVETVQLANRLEKMGKQVKFAIHPIAGRMPGHMHVLLAEADVDPDMLFEMEQVNPQLHQTDLVLIVGACDVVNPAATSTQDTPIAGMPILAAAEAKQVLVCNLDGRPGYSGVENPLYADPKTILMFGDAKSSLSRLLRGLD